MYPEYAVEIIRILSNIEIWIASGVVALWMLVVVTWLKGVT